MNNRVLEIIFRLKDEVTKNFNTMAKKFISDSRYMARQINDISNAALMLGAAITGPMALAFHGAAQRSRVVSDELEKVKTVTAAFQLSVATAMIPTVQTLTNALGRLYQAWNSLGPVVQTNIVQIGLWVGIALTAVGVIGKLVVNLLRARAAIVAFVLALTPVQWIIIGIVGSIMLLVGGIVLMIVHWDEVKKVVIPILNAIEIGIKMVQLGFNKMMGGLVDGLITASVHLSGFMKVLARVPGAQQEAFLAASDALDKFSGSLRQDSIEQHKMVAQIEGEIQKILEAGMSGTVPGGLADGVDKSVEQIRKTFGGLIKWLSGGAGLDYTKLKEQIGDVITQTKTMADVMKETSAQTAQAMSRSLTEFFFNPFSENVKSAREMFADFGRSIMQILADVAAKWLITMTLGQMFGITSPFNLLGLKEFHAGGMIRAHNGFLARDEVPIIAQSGEAVLSRRAVGALGEDNVNLLNRGRSLGNQYVTNQPVVVIQAWDAQDVYRNRGVITGIVEEALTRNTSLRNTMRRYT